MTHLFEYYKSDPQALLRVGTKSLIVRTTEVKEYLKVEATAKEKVYRVYHAAAERVAALVAGRPYSAFLQDGKGHLHEMMVRSVLQAENVALQQNAFGTAVIILRNCLEEMLEQSAAAGKSTTCLPWTH